MQLKDKIARSKDIRPASIAGIPSKGSNQDYVGLTDSDRLLVLPIWDHPIDYIEGPEYQRYIQQNPDYNQLYLRSAVADMLVEASKNLPKQYKLIVRAGHRPVPVQKAVLEGVKQDYLNDNPDSSPDQALEFARTYVSDPDIKLPPHCCGAAVDVDLLDTTTGKLVDFGCPVNTDSPLSFLYSEEINKLQATNRQILLTAMLDAGFASLSSEWWHYSYGDQTWAWFYSQPEAIYSIKEPNL